MTSFDDRESAFENKFAHDAEMQFKAEMRANKLIGVWAATLLGRDDADAYAKEVMRADMKEAGFEDVIEKVAGDLGDKATEADIRAKYAQCLAEAKASLLD